MSARSHPRAAAAGRRALGLAARLARWVSTHDLATFLTLVLSGLCLWAFFELGDYVVEEPTHRVDERVLLAMRSAEDPSDPVGPPWLEEMVRDFTAFGGVGALTLFSLAALGYVLLRGKRASALYLFCAIGVGIGLSFLLKSVYDRPRPDLVTHGSVVYTKSFPSGHSMLSAVTYLTLGVLLARDQPRARLKLYVLGFALLMTLLVGFSRVYLGVHWPSDVVGGWSAGIAWAALAWYVARRLERRGHLEATEADPGERAALEEAA